MIALVKLISAIGKQNYESHTSLIWHCAFVEKKSNSKKIALKSEFSAFLISPENCVFAMHFFTAMVVFADFSYIVILMNSFCNLNSIHVI